MSRSLSWASALENSEKVRHIICEWEEGRGKRRRGKAVRPPQITGKLARRRARGRRVQAVRRTPPVTIPVLAPESGGLQSRAAHTLGACGRQPRDSARSLMRWLLSARFPPCRDASGSEVAAVERPSKSRLFPLVLSASPSGQRRNKSEDQAPQKERRPRAPASGGRARRLRCGVGGRAGHATRRSVFLGGRRRVHRLRADPPTGSGLSDPEIPFNSSVSQSLVVPGARIPRRGVFVMPLHFSGWLERVPAPYGRTWVLPGAGPLPLVLIGHAHPQPRLQGVPPVRCPQLQNQEARCPQTAGRLRGPQSPRTHASSCAGVEITGLRLFLTAPVKDRSHQRLKPPLPPAPHGPPQSLHVSGTRWPCFCFWGITL